MLDLNNIGHTTKKIDESESNEYKNTILPSTSEISIIEKLKKG
jgi:hypothetical protein